MMSLSNTDFDAVIARKDWASLETKFKESSFDKVSQCFQKYLENISDNNEAQEVALYTFSAIPKDHLSDSDHLAYLSSIIVQSHLFQLEDSELLGWFSGLCFRSQLHAQVLMNHSEAILTARDYHGNNVLHYAVEHNLGEEILETLLERRPELIHEANQAGLTPLHVVQGTEAWSCLSTLLLRKPKLNEPVRLQALFDSGLVFLSTLSAIENLVYFFSPDDDDLELPDLCIGVALLHQLSLENTEQLREQLSDEQQDQLQQQVLDLLLTQKEQLDSEVWAQVLAILSAAGDLEGIQKLFEAGHLDDLQEAGSIICQTFDGDLIEWYLENLHGKEKYQDFENPLSKFWQIPDVEDIDFYDDRVHALKKLLKFGIDPNGTVEGGLSIAQMAAANGSRREIKVLRAYQADLNHKDDEGNSILHFANLNPNTFFYLLEKGIDPHASNDAGERVLSGFKDPDIDPKPWIAKLCQTNPHYLKLLVKDCSLLLDKPDSELIWESPMVIAALACLPEHQHLLFQRWSHLIPDNPLDGAQHPAHLAWLAPLLEALMEPEEQLQVLLESPPSVFSEFLRFASPKQIELLKPAFSDQAAKALLSTRERLPKLETDLAILESSPERALFDRLRAEILVLRRQLKSLLLQSEELEELPQRYELEAYDKRLGEYWKGVQACQGRLSTPIFKEVPEDIDIMLGLVRLFPSGRFDDEAAIGQRLYQVYDVGLSSLEDLHTLGLAKDQPLSPEQKEFCGLPEGTDDREVEQELLRRYLDQEGLVDLWGQLEVESLSDLAKEHPTWSIFDFFQLKAKLKA